MSSTLGKGWAFLIVWLFRPLKSMQKKLAPSFFLTMMTAAANGFWESDHTLLENLLDLVLFFSLDVMALP